MPRSNSHRASSASKPSAPRGSLPAITACQRHGHPQHQPRRSSRSTTAPERSPSSAITASARRPRPASHARWSSPSVKFA